MLLTTYILNDFVAMWVDGGMAGAGGDGFDNCCPDLSPSSSNNDDF